jgi:hypothetical protein
MSPTPSPPTQVKVPTLILGWAWALVPANRLSAKLAAIVAFVIIDITPGLAPEEVAYHAKAIVDQNQRSCTASRYGSTERIVAGGVVKLHTTCAVV